MVPLIGFTVDPAEAERLVDRFVVVDAGRIRLLVVHDQPDAFLGPVVFLQPFAPGCPGGSVDRGYAVFLHQGLLFRMRF